MADHVCASAEIQLAGCVDTSGQCVRCGTKRGRLRASIRWCGLEPKASEVVRRNYVAHKACQAVDWNRMGGNMTARVLATIVLFFVTFASMAAVPESCRVYQRYLTRQAYSVFGPDAPVPILAAQIQQESACRKSAVSPVGALGLTQFMPATARDLAQRYPNELGPADPLNWKWAIGAQVRYMRDIVPRPWRTRCDWWAAKLSAYNGGEGWVARDQAMCIADRTPSCTPCVADRWFGNVADHPDLRRSPANIKQNRDYPTRILLRLTPEYVRAGYGRGIECEP